MSTTKLKNFFHTHQKKKKKGVQNLLKSTYTLTDKFHLAKLRDLNNYVQRCLTCMIFTIDKTEKLEVTKMSNNRDD